MPEKFSDREVIQKIKNGEIDYYSDIFRRYHIKITSYIRRFITFRDDVDDLVQIVFIKYYKAIDRIDETKPVLPYLVEIAKNEIKMFFRSRKKLLPLDESLRVAQPESGLPNFDLQKILTSVSQMQRKILQLVSEGYTYNEIAKIVGTPINTIKTTIRRIRIKFHKQNQT